MTAPASPPPRPAWARSLDRLVLLLARPVGRLLGRPPDALLTRLARKDRPAPPVRVPRPEEMGLRDLLSEGRRALELGQLGEALHCFSALCEQEPRSAWAWHGRGDALQLMGEPEAALSAYDRAAMLQPRVGIHQGGRANALLALGRTTEGKQARTEALRLDPTLGWMWSSRR